MADGSTYNSHSTLDFGRLRLEDALGEDRHLVACCPAPRCEARTPCDPASWIGEGLGRLPLRVFSERLRCSCGSRQARLEIWPGAFAPIDHPYHYIFR